MQGAILSLYFFLCGVNSLKVGFFDDQFNCSTSIQNPDHTDVHEVLTWLMNKNNVTSLWLPINRHYMTSWRWLLGDQEYNGGSILDPIWAKPWYNCGVLKTLDKAVDGIPCNTIIPHFLCQHAGNCSNSDLCFNISTTYYTIHDMRKTWYSAKVHCQSQGGTLASVPAEDKEEIIKSIQYLVKKPINLWIGLRNAEFQVINAHYDTLNVDTSDDIGRSVDTFIWDDNYPCECDDDCVVLSESHRGGYRWRTENCSETHAIYCQQDLLRAKFDMVQPPPTPVPTPTGWFGIKLEEYTLILVIVGASLGLLLIILICVICMVSCRLHKKKLKKRGGPWDEYYKPDQSETFLMKSVSSDTKIPVRKKYGQMPGLTGTMSNPNIPAGLEPTDFTLKAVLARGKPTVKQQEYLKQSYRAIEHMTEACYEWIVKDLDEQLLVHNEQKPFLTYGLGHSEATVDTFKRMYNVEFGVAGIYLWRSEDTPNESWIKLCNIIKTYKYQDFNPWLENLFL